MSKNMSKAVTAEVAKAVNTMPLIHKVNNKKPVNIDSIEAMTPEMDKMVTGTFINVECPGQTAKVCSKLYKGMQYFCKVFEDNERATIPWSVARFINERCEHHKHSYILDSQGNPVKNVKPVSRYKFMIESMNA